jgi:hypothetical protein
VEKNTAQLAALQTTRKALAKAALEEAQILAHMAYAKGEQYDPSRDFPVETLTNGSEFSSAGIRRVILRKQRVDEAEFYAYRRWNTKSVFPKFAYRFSVA